MVNMRLFPAPFVEGNVVKQKNVVQGVWKVFWIAFIAFQTGCSIPCLYAQEEYLRYYEQQGDQASDLGFHDAAWRYYKMALRFQVRNDTLLYKCAEAARRYNHYDDAEYLYLKLLGYHADTLFPELKLRLGEMALYNDNPFAGKEYLEDYINQKQTKTSELSFAKLLYEQCQWAVENYQMETPFEVLHLGKEVNSRHSETAPVLVMKDKLYFISLRPYVEEVHSNIIPHGAVSHVYQSSLSKGLQFGQAKRIEGKLNTDYAHTTHVAFDEKGKRLFLTRCSLSQKTPVHCIYMSEWKKNGWTKPRKMKGSVHVKGYSSMHPAIAYVGQETLLFFSSDRPGGVGGFDIWYVILDKNTTHRAVNLGYPVNSSKDEISPFYCADSVSLYFSSNGHLGYGGFDIFKSKGIKNAWSEPKNLGKPINSPANDLYFSINPPLQTAWLASNRKGSFFEDNQTCCNDIYAVKVINDTMKTDTISSTIDHSCDSCRSARIHSLLPIVLYFDNDLPHRDHHDSLAKEPFGLLADAYLHSKNRFSAAYSHGLSSEEEDMAKQKISLFFDSSVAPELKKMEQLLEYMYADLKAGKRILLSVKGFASPLHTQEYNRWLSKRRIHSFIKELMVRENGILKPFLQGKDGQEPLLMIKELAMGSDTADETVGKSSKDVRNSVFSPEASKERRVEVLYYEYVP